jgi:hypothetical protein
MEISFGSELHDDIDIVVIVEELKQFYDVRMIDFAQNIDLRASLLCTMLLDKATDTLIEVMCIFFIAKSSFVLMFCTR